jgi:plastocyanin
MKYVLWAIIVIIILGGAWWLLMPQSTIQPETDANATAGTQLAGSDTGDTTGMVGGDAAVNTDTSVTAAPTVIVDISGQNFSFSKKEIRVKEGDIVQINFTAGDMMHDWVLDEFNARTKIVKAGESTSVTFVADKKGTFEYYCSVGQHRANGMVGSLIVE